MPVAVDPQAPRPHAMRKLDVHDFGGTDMVVEFGLYVRNRCCDIVTWVAWNPGRAGPCYHKNTKRCLSS